MGPPMEPAQLAAITVEYMEPGPALAGWLEVAAGAATSLDENGLTGLAIAARKQAAHTHGVELTAVAQITSRAAAADRRVGVSNEGRPARVCRDAVGQLEMALRLSHDGAQAWADLALTMTWRLPRTFAALASGWIDLDRAEIIARATSVLGEEAARVVEAKVVPEARWRTYAQLRAWLCQLVIAADPDGAEERRQKAERDANVRLYADDDQTATLLADKLPQIETASGFARINAMARARKAAGLPGSLGLHRAQVLLGLILGTPPPTPPAQEAPPDQPPPLPATLAPTADLAPRAGPAATADPGPAACRRTSCRRRRTSPCPPTNGTLPPTASTPTATRWTAPMMARIQAVASTRGRRRRPGRHRPGGSMAAARPTAARAGSPRPGRRETTGRGTAGCDVALGHAGWDRRPAGHARQDRGDHTGPGPPARARRRGRPSCSVAGNRH